MPSYKVTDSLTGKSFKLTGDSPPTEQELSQIFDQYRPKEEKSVGGFVKNVGKSAVENIKGIGSALVNVVNPDMEKNTIANVGRVAVGGVQKFVPGQQKQEQYFDNVTNFYKDRYGSLDKIGDTLYNDPVGVAMDISSIATGAGGVLRGGAKVANIAGKAGVANKIGRVADVASDVARYTDPIQFGVGASKRAVGRYVSKAGQNVEDFGKQYGVRSTRINQTGQNAFNKTGENIADYQARKNFYGQDVNKFEENVLNPISEAFDDSTLRSGKTVSKNLLIKQFEQQIDDLLFDKETGLPTLDPETIKLANYMQEQLDLVRSLPDNLDLGYLTRQRKLLDKSTPSVQFDKPGNFRQKTLSDTYRGVVNETAGTTELGKEYSKAIKFKEALEKAPKGKGNLPLGLNKGVWGNLTQKVPVIGPLAGMAVESLVNNPEVIGATSKGIQSIGKGLQRPPKFFDRTGNVASQAYRSGKVLSRFPRQEIEQPKLQDYKRDRPQTFIKLQKGKPSYRALDL